jgi:hypothetical protein
MQLTRIGPLSVGRLAFVLYAAIGFIVGAMFAVFSLFGAALGAHAGEDSAIFGALFGLGAIVFFPVLYGVFGGLGGMLMAALYNVVAGFTGGVEVTLEPASGVR